MQTLYVQFEERYAHATLSSGARGSYLYRQFNFRLPSVPTAEDSPTIADSKKYRLKKKTTTMKKLYKAIALCVGLLALLLNVKVRSAPVLAPWRLLLAFAALT